MGDQSDKDDAVETFFQHGAITKDQDARLLHVGHRSRDNVNVWDNKNV